MREPCKNVIFFHLQFCERWKKVSFHPLIFCVLGIALNILVLKSSHLFPIELWLNWHISLFAPFFLPQEHAKLSVLYHAITRSLLQIQISKKEHYVDALYWLWRTWYSVTASSKLAYICRPMLSPTDAEDLKMK